MKTTVDPYYSSFFSAAEKLILCLDEEYEALIQLNTDKVLEAQIQKKRIGKTLKILREKINQNNSKNEADEKQFWQLWQNIYDKLNRNQKFLNHSLKNISKISENIKSLLGQKTFYNSQGNQVKTSSLGKVVLSLY